MKPTLALLTILLALAPLPAWAANMVVGTVSHVSATDIAVNTGPGQTQKFVLVPAFKNVFSKDGKTTEEMSALRPGTPVTVYYTRVLGVRHASRILVNGSARAFKT